jgi:4-amino-4-deoxy-L-arabinose transferase-like glycosyltransferase
MSSATVEQTNTAMIAWPIRRPIPATLLAMALAVTAGCFLVKAFSPWHWFYDENGALYGYIGSNYIRSGIAATRGGAQHWTSFDGPVRAPEFYSTHPPLFCWLCGLFQWLFGIRPVVVRLVPELSQLASMVPLFLLGRRLFGSDAAAWGTLAYALLPITAYFGCFVCYESTCNFFVLLAVYCYVRINQDGWSLDVAAAMCGALLAGMWTDWPAYFAAMGIGVDWFFRNRGWSRLRCAVPWAVGLVSFALFVGFIYQLGGAGSGGTGSLLNALKNRTGFSPDENYSVGALLSFLARQNLKLYGLGFLLLIAGGAIALRNGHAARPLVVLLAVAVLHVALFSYGAMTHEYWTYYFTGPTALGAMAIFARFADLPGAAVLRWSSVAVLLIQSVWVVYDYYDAPGNSGYTRYADYHIRYGQIIGERAQPDEVIMMSFGWGEGAWTGYYAQRPVVRVHAAEDVERIRDHPDFTGGYLVLTSDFDVGDSEQFFHSLESIAELSVYDSPVRIVHVPPSIARK